jgi:predicted DNA-binding protein
MTTMVRKQIDIEPRQADLLEHWAEEAGRTEADIIREALERWLQSSQHRQEANTAWEEELTFIEAGAAQGSVLGGRTWAREELYAERLNRCDRDSD